jgi:WhiB family redox-sensing transcriptional regulator
MATAPARPAISLPGVAPDPAWAARGACCSHPDPGLWFARAGSKAHTRAVAICRTCPVAAPCLRYALSVPGLDGTWAGTTPNKRTRLRNQIKARSRLNAA